MSVTNQFFVYVNSRERLAGTDENFTFAVNFPSSGYDFSHVVLLNALIPKSYYLIQGDAQENTFQLKEDNTTVNINVPIGSYLLNSFKTVISNLLTTNSPNSLTYTMTYPSLAGADTGKWTFTQSNPLIVSSLIFNGHLFEPFGFLPDSINVFDGSSLTSTCVIKLQSEDRLLLHSNCVNSPNGDDVLASINSTTSINYSSINYLCPAPEYYSRSLSSKDNNVYSFCLTDESGELIELNGLNLNFTLLFYKKDPIFDQIRNFLKMIASK